MSSSIVLAGEAVHLASPGDFVRVELRSVNADGNVIAYQRLVEVSVLDWQRCVLATAQLLVLMGKKKI